MRKPLIGRCTVAALLILAATPSFSVTLDAEFWFQFIHCSNSMGFQANHGEGTKPTNETFRHDGDLVKQCHGIPGQDGLCFSEGDACVFCSSTEFTSRCYATVQCPNGSSITCGGPGQSSFAGIRVIDGQLRSFVLCRAGGMLMEKKICP